MKTSSISLRVADFLKSYPPFNFIKEEELLRLAGTGRVKFHEDGELIYEQGEKRSSYFYVIQQGTVNIYRNTQDDEELIDVRVEGNLLGMLWGGENEPYQTSARTASETILYALPRAIFETIANGEPQVKAFLNAYYSSFPTAADASEGIAEAPSDWLKHSEPIRERANRSLLTARPEEKVREIARRIAPGNQEAVVITDDQRRPLGIITESDLSGKVASGDVPIDAPASALMSSPVECIPPGLNVGELILRMLNRRMHHLCITANGTPETPVLGLVAERDLALLHGRLPTMLTNEILVAKTPTSLAAARDRADELLLHYLETEAPISWIADFISEIDNSLTERALALAKQKLASQGRNGPGVPFCWMAFHSEGRQERLLRSPQRNGIVFADPETGNGEAAAYYFVELAREVADILETCGFPRESRDMRADNPRWCRPLSEWKEHYSDWIANPIENNILKQTPFFDMRPVGGEVSLTADLYAHIATELKAQPHFVPLLANDAMANLPPVTIFRDSVMDKSGILWTSIDTKLHILYPLVDMTRVLALEHGLADKASTVARLRRLGELLPDQATLLSESIDAINFGLNLQTSFGLRRGDDGQFIRPADLDLIDRERIKTAFRTVAQLLEYTSQHFGLRSSVQTA